MPQTAYNRNADEAFAGLIADSRFHEIESKIGLEDISFGFGLCAGKANPESVVKLPDINNVVILDDAGAYTAGAIVVTVNGATATAAYNTDKDTTLTDLAAAIQALATVSTATYAAGTHTITVVAASDVDLTITVDISAITGAMTITSITGTSTDLFRGVAVQSQFKNRNMPTIGASTYTSAAYIANDAVSVMRKGVLWVEVDGATVIDSAAYLITTGADKGKFSDSNASPNIAVPTGVFRSATSGAGIAKLEINIP